MTSRIAALTLFLLATLPQWSYAQLEGKLFTTPEQRTYLDALRREFLAASREAGFDIEESEIPPLPEDTNASLPERVEYTLGGIMARRDGSHTIWLNNRSLTEKELPEGALVVNENNRLALRFRTDAGEKLLLPGQTIEINSGAVQERYQRPSPMTGTDDAEQP